MDLADAFDAFDANDDGIISPSEFRRGLEKLSIRLSATQTRDLLRYMDRDGDGHIDIREFKYYQVLQQTHCHHTLHEDFPAQFLAQAVMGVFRQ